MNININIMEQENLLELSNDNIDDSENVIGEKIRFKEYLDESFIYENDKSPQTSESNSKDRISDHNEENRKPMYETYIIGFKNEPTIKPKKTKCIPFPKHNKKSDYFSFNLPKCTPMNQTKETELLGKKRLEPDTTNYELIMNEIIKNTLINYIQFFNDISLYVYESDFKINIDLIQKKDFIEENMNKTFKEILLMMEDSGLKESERFENKIKSLIELEKESNNLPFIYETLKMKLSDLILVYIYDRINKLYIFDLKTLKDSIYSKEEKTIILEQIPKYLKAQIELSLSTNDNEIIVSQPSKNLLNTHLSNIDQKEKNHSSKIIFKTEKILNLFEIIKIGDSEENLTRITVEECFKFISEMIEKITGHKLENVSIYKDIYGNSSEKFFEFFKLSIAEILKRKNKKFIDDILNRNDSTEETEFLKTLFNEKFLNIITDFIEDIHYYFKLSNGDKIKSKTFKDIKDQRIIKKREIIIKKIKTYIEQKGRIRAKKGEKIIEQKGGIREKKGKNKINDC